MIHDQKLRRCTWCGSDPLNVDYHDREWGVPVFDDRTLFEFLTLEGAQAGLSWATILKKRDGYRRAFHHFDVERVAEMDEDAKNALMANPEIVRNRLKISSTVENARAAIEMKNRHGSLCAFLWGFVDGRPQTNAWESLAQIPAETDLSWAMSRELRRAGFRFVGPTIMYAFMQAVGMVNDHEIGCFRHAEIRRNEVAAPC